MIRIVVAVLLLVLGAPAVWGQCGPGQQLRPIGGGRFSCANTDKVVVKDANNNVSIGTTLLGPRTIGAGANQLPAAAAGNAGWITVVTDAASGSDCTAGGGTAAALCRSNGSAWVPLGGAGGSGAGDVTGPTGADLGEVPVFDTTGKQISGSGCTVTDGELTCPGGFSAGDGTAPGAVELPETAANGEDKIIIAAPASITASYELTLPPGQPDGQVLQFAAPVAGVSAGSWVAPGSGGGGIPPREYVLAKCANGTAGPGVHLPVSNSPTPVCLTGTNTLFGALEFPDSDNDFTAQDHFRFPAASTVTFQLKWMAAATTGNVVWQLQTACVADAETGNPAWNTAQTVTDTAKGTTLQWNDAEIASVTTTGCTAGEQFFWRLLRNRTHASDTVTGPVGALTAYWTFQP